MLKMNGKWESLHKSIYCKKILSEVFSVECYKGNIAGTKSVDWEHMESILSLQTFYCSLKYCVTNGKVQPEDQAYEYSIFKIFMLEQIWNFEKYLIFPL